MQTQNKLITDYFDKGGALTPKEASEMFGIERFGARIGEIKAAKYPLAFRWIKAPNRCGKMTKYKQYWKGEQNVTN